MADRRDRQFRAIRSNTNAPSRTGARSSRDSARDRRAGREFSAVSRTRTPATSRKQASNAPSSRQRRGGDTSARQRSAAEAARQRAGAAQTTRRRRSGAPAPSKSSADGVGAAQRQGKLRVPQRSKHSKNVRKLDLPEIEQEPVEPDYGFDEAGDLDFVDGYDSALGDDGGQLSSRRIGEIRQEDRAERMRRSSRKHFLRFVGLVVVIVALVVGAVVLYNSPAFTIQNVSVKGVEHLTNDEMAQLANVPADTTLLRVDADTIANRVKQSSWVEDVRINRVFPDTLEIDVTERKVAAIVEVLNESGSAVKQWAIATDHMWLMPIPAADSEAAQTTSAKVYEDAESVLHITDVPHGTQAEIGKICSDENVNNALAIVEGLTTDLANQIVKISAAGTAETSLILDSGVEIAFGKAEDIRDKERVILQIMEDNPDGVAYINVRMVENPTWRSI